MTFNELLDETIEYYKTNPRGVGLNSYGNLACKYITDEGAMCAVGRCLTDPKSFQNKFHTVGISDIADDHHISGYFKEEYKDVPLEWWDMLQHFHDPPILWNADGGLSELGKKRAEELRERYA